MERRDTAYKDEFVHKPRHNDAGPEQWLWGGGATLLHLSMACPGWTWEGSRAAEVYFKYMSVHIEIHEHVYTHDKARKIYVSK